MARCNKFFSQFFIERTSAFTSKGSITIEASIVVSFFFFAAICLACLFEIMALQIHVKSAMHSVGKEMAMEAYVNPIFSTNKLEQKIAETVGEERLDKSMIVGGRNGIDCRGSKIYKGSTIMDLCACYQIEIPITMFRLPVIIREEIIRVKGWSGEEKSHAPDSENEIVYVTDYGVVYHKELSCTYLELSIQAVPLEGISELRNEAGGKYEACEFCGKNIENKKNVYITRQGKRYHSSLECSGLSRNIYAVLLSDVRGLGGCSKCGK